jgi:flagellar basal body-associated protein FliL
MENNNNIFNGQNSKGATNNQVPNMGNRQPAQPRPQSNIPYPNQAQRQPVAPNQNQMQRPQGAQFQQQAPQYQNQNAVPQQPIFKPQPAPTQPVSTKYMPPKKSNKKIVVLISVIVSVVLIGIGAIIFFALNNKTGTSTNTVVTTTAPSENNTETPFNTNEIRGNTIGNSSSSVGMGAVKVNDSIYFVDSTNVTGLGGKNRIVKISSDYSEAQEIVDPTTNSSIDAFSLNYYDGYLYVSTLENIFKLNIETNEIVTIANGHFNCINLINGNIYARKKEGLKEQIVKIDADGNQTILVEEDDRIESMIAFGGYIYYSTTNIYEDTNAIYKVDYNGQNKTLLLTDENYYRLCDLSSDNNFLYFIKKKEALSDALPEDGSLYRVSLDGQNKEIVINSQNYAPISTYNFDDNYIYYSFVKSRENDKIIGEIRRMSLDGSSDEKILDNQTASLTILDNIMFFYLKIDRKTFGELPIFVNTDGTNRVELNMEEI